jgi:hypothetical protein
MAEIIPVLPDDHLVRTYPKDYADTDTESEGEAQFEADTDDEEDQLWEKNSLLLCNAILQMVSSLLNKMKKWKNEFDCP